MILQDKILCTPVLGLCYFFQMKTILARNIATHINKPILIDKLNSRGKLTEKFKYEGE